MVKCRWNEVSAVSDQQRTNKQGPTKNKYCWIRGKLIETILEGQVQSNCRTQSFSPSLTRERRKRFWNKQVSPNAILISFLPLVVGVNHYRAEGGKVRSWVKGTSRRGVIPERSPIILRGGPTAMASSPKCSSICYYFELHFFPHIE